MSWQNWSGSVRCPQARIERPEGPEALAARVAAYDGAGALRALGSGHSFVPFWADGDTLLDLGAFVGLESVAGRVARLKAGTPLHAIGPLLAAEGLALANMGDIDRQTLAGAVATGTHGTGRELGSLSAQVVAVEVVDGLGRIRRLTQADEVAAARVAMGMLGVMTAIELAVVPAYGLHERNHLEGVEACLEQLDERLGGHRHHEFWWVPRVDRCIAKTLDQIEVPAQPRLDEVAFGEEGERFGASWQIFPSTRDLKFNEMEYAVPAATAVACFRAVRARMLRDFPKLMWPVEYRVLAGDDGWLSPTAGGEVATLSIHQAAAVDPGPLFDAIEPILRDHGGRPHWGKQHGLDGSGLARLYPKFEDFCRYRRELDPYGRFLTRYLADRFA
ncbi:MAG: FAD-binding protein [Gammaproteobacteria bacterium]|nr:FAD-binding protein [Gammaproteobacteria bacterium]